MFEEKCHNIYGIISNVFLRNKLWKLYIGLYWSTIYVQYIVLANLVFKKRRKIEHTQILRVFHTSGLSTPELQLQVFHHTATYIPVRPK